MRGYRIPLVLVLLVLLLAAVGLYLVAPAGRTNPALEPAISYLHAQQMPDGGLVGFTENQSDDFTTVRALLALGAARRSPDTLTSASGNTPMTYLAARASQHVHDSGGRVFPGRAGMLAAGVVAVGGDPRNLAGLDLIARLRETYDGSTGAYQSTASEGFSSGEAGSVNQLWAIIGLAAAGEPVPRDATEMLFGLHEPDGGWGFGQGSDVDITAAAVQALIASGNVVAGDARVQEAVAFLREAQLESGGWTSFGDEPSPDSTAAVIQTLVAVGESPGAAEWARGGRTPRETLAALQAPDGSFGGNALGTANAIPGLLEVPLPVRPGGLRLPIRLGLAGL